MPRLDRIFIILWFLSLIIWLIGTIAPLLPWSIISFLWILFIHRTTTFQIPTIRIIIFALLVIISNIIDYYLPIRWTKKYGWTKAWITGSTIWLIWGIFLFPPIWMIIWPFIGAFIGEYLSISWTWEKAFRSARGSFVWFLLTTGFKIILGWRMLAYIIKIIW